MRTKDRFLQIRVTPDEKAAIERAATRAGLDMSRWVLAKVLPAPQQTFQHLVAALASDPANRRFNLAELNDFLTALDRVELATAVDAQPVAELAAFEANYLAAMIETAVHKLGSIPPAWTSQIPPLAEPWFGSTANALRLHLLLESPPAFRRRNLFVDATVGDRV